MNERPASRAGVGASSILLIVVVLCLTAFGVLTLVSARVDERLTQNTAAGAKSYYLADAEAQRKLMEIDTALLAGRDAATVPGVTEKDGIAAFAAPFGEGRAIAVEIAIADGTYKIVSYRTTSLDGSND